MKDEPIQHELSNGVNMTLTCEERLEAEIAERRRLEAALRQSEERLRSITSSIPMGMFVLDPEGVITLSEGKGLTALGLKPGQVVGESIFDVYKDFPQVLADCRRALQGETLATIVDVGNQVFETSYQPIYDANHQLTGVMGIANDVTERLRAEASLRDQQAYLRQIIDLIPGFVFAKDRNGRFTLVNKAVADAYGTTVEALTGRLESEFSPNAKEAAYFHAADVAIMDSLQEKLIPQEKITDTAGNVRWLQTIKRPIIDKHGVSNEIMGVATDITLQKEVEDALRESETRLRAEQKLFTGGPAVVFRWVAADNWPVDYVSPNLLTQFGYQPEDLLTGHIPYASIVYPDDLMRVASEVAQYTEEGRETFEQSYRLIRADGQVRWIYDFTVILRNEQGQVTHYAGYILDLTERHETEIALREREAFLQQVLDTIPQAVFWKNTQSVYLGCNQNFARDAGFSSPQEVVNKTDYDMVWTKEQADAFRLIDQQVIESDAPQLNYVQPIEQPDGKQVWLETSKVPLHDANGKVIGLLGLYEDVTEHKTADQLLRESEQRLTSLVQQTPLAVIEWNKNFEVSEWNLAAEKIFGYSRQEALGRHATFFIPLEYHAHVDAVWQGLLSQTGGTRSTNGNVTKDGRFIVCDWYNSPLINANGETTGVVSIVEDITERKKLDEAFRQSEAQFRSLFEQSADAILLLEDGIFTDCNQATVQMMRAKDKAQFLSLHPSVLSPEIQPDGRSSGEKADEMIRIALEKGSNRFEWMHRRVDGEDFRVEVLLTSIAIGERRALHTVWRDITERKEAEDQLTRLATIIEATSDFVGIANPDGKALYMNRAGRQMIGIGETEDITNIPISEFTPDRMVPVIMNQGFPTAIKDGRWRGESGLKHRNGQEIIVSQVIISNKDQAGNLQFLATIARDITEQKRNEEELQKLTSAVEQSENLVLITNKDGIIEYVNHGFEKLTGYTKKFAIGKTPRILKSGKHDQAYYKTLWDTILAGKPHYGVSINRKKNGEFYYEEKTITPIRNHAGEITHFLSTAQDITRRLQLEQEIRDSLERRGRQVQLSTQVAQEIAAAANLEDLYQRIVTQVKEQFGYYHAQLLQYNPALDTLDLVVGYGEVGDKMLALHHSIPMGIGLIGTAASTGQSVLRADVSTDASWQTNNLLPDTKGELVVPIKLGERVLGVLDVQSDTVGALTPDDQLVLEGLCGQIAIAIGNTLLRQEMEVRIQELNALQNYMTREGWQNYRADKHTKGYRFDHTGLQPLLSLPVPQTNGKSVVAELEKPAGTLDNARLVSKPLVIRGGEIGVLAIQDDPERPLSPDEQQLLEAISLQVSEALEAARLFEQTQDALNEQERLSAELETVAQVSTAASTILEVDTLLQSVVDLTKSSFVLYHAHIYLLDSTNEKLILKAGAGKVGRLMVLEGREIPILADSLVARAARIRQGVIENDVRKTVDFLPNPLLPNTRSEMAIPMIVGEKLVGVLDLQSDKVGFFTEESLRTQKTLASQIAVAVENAKLYDQQVQTTEKLRDVDRLKSEFLASMSHELRTPLNSIIGFADVLLEGLDGDLNERMEEDVRLIRESGRHLRELIGDILDMSKIEAGKMELRYEDIDLHQLANDIVATAGPLASSKSLGLYLDLNPDVTSIEADRTRLRQVLWNIVGNAIKFTERGSVTLMMEMQEQSLLVAIKDTGIGIKQEDIPIVFEQFRQIDGSLNRSVGGTGLGMPITKKLVELHGGEIWVESAPGKGTTFWFRLPRYRPTKPTTASLPAL